MVKENYKVFFCCRGYWAWAKDLCPKFKARGWMVPPAHILSSVNAIVVGPNLCFDIARGAFRVWDPNKEIFVDKVGRDFQISKSALRRAEKIVKNIKKEKRK